MRTTRSGYAAQRRTPPPPDDPRRANLTEVQRSLLYSASYSGWCWVSREVWPEAEELVSLGLCSHLAPSRDGDLRLLHASD